MRTSATEVSSMPDSIWNPIQSASAATTFSAFLSGIVLSAMVQIGISQAKPGGNRPASLRFSAVSLVTLLASTYMFVLLAGMASTPAEDPRNQIVAPKAALLFSISGSVLAIGAVSTLALMLLVFRESKVDDKKVHGEVVIGAVETTLILGAATAGVFLIFGYDDIYRLSANGADLPLSVIFVMVLLIYGVGGCALLARAAARKWIMEVLGASGQSSRRSAATASSWLFLVPTMAYLVVAHAVESSNPTLAATVTTVCAAWAGVSMTALLVVAMEPRAHRAKTKSPP